MKRLILALLLAAGPLTARAAEFFTFTTTEKPVAAEALAQASTSPAARITTFTTNLEYGDGHRETATGKCSAVAAPRGAAFDETGVCVAPGAFTLDFHCRGADCWGALTGALEGHHNGLNGLVTYQNNAEGISGVGRWND
jgi:hypothetical protein